MSLTAYENNQFGGMDKLRLDLITDRLGAGIAGRKLDGFSVPVQNSAFQRVVMEIKGVIRIGFYGFESVDLVEVIMVITDENICWHALY